MVALYLRKSRAVLKPLVILSAFGSLLFVGRVEVALSQQVSKEKLEHDYYTNSFRAAPRDAFPVLFNPSMGKVEDGDQILQPNEWVIAIALKGEAKAYPVDVMGLHELINDVVGGTPITVCW